MIGFGTVLNVAGIAAGGALGLLGGKLLKPQCQETLMRAAGVCVMFIGMAGAMEKMLAVTGGQLTSGKSMMLVLSIALGAVVGELLDLERQFERFGEWLKVKTGNSREKSFVEGFVAASLTVSIGAMAIVGSIEDGMFGNYSILGTKAILDFVIVLVMTCSLGKGCAFSAIPVGCFQGAMTLLARLLKPLMTEAALWNLALVGSVMIFCVGLNLVWEKRIRVANLLPGILFAVLLSGFPLS